MEVPCNGNGTPIITQTQGPVSGSYFNTGTTTIEYTTSDDCNNSATCSFAVTVIPDNSGSSDLSVRFFLEGAYEVNTGLMRDDLRDRGLLPAADPWSLSSDIPPAALAVTGNNALVDWVLIELRDPNDLATTLYTTSGLVQRDGDLVDADGTSLVSIDYPLPNEVYILIHHKNHLRVMSAGAVAADVNTITFDFTTQNSYQGGGTGQKELSPGIWGLYTGESNADHQVTGADKAYWATENGLFNIYSSNDFNVDGEVNGADKTYWNQNNGLFSLIP